jgi:hypothetical protein
MTAPSLFGRLVINGFNKSSWTLTDMRRSQQRVCGKSREKGSELQYLHHLKIRTRKGLQMTHRFRKTEILLLCVDPFIRIDRLLIILPILPERKGRFIDLNTITLLM